MSAEWAELFPGEPVLFPLGWTHPGEPARSALRAPSGVDSRAR
ncbi:hypothetical protein ACF9IK_33050 [Kitasatospora hibisci]